MGGVSSMIVYYWKRPPKGIKTYKWTWRGIKAAAMLRSNKLSPPSELELLGPRQGPKASIHFLQSHLVLQNHRQWQRFLLELTHSQLRQLRS